MEKHLKHTLNTSYLARAPILPLLQFGDSTSLRSSALGVKARLTHRVSSGLPRVGTVDLAVQASFPKGSSVALWGILPKS